MTRIIGIDPGILHTGWAIIDSVGNSRKYIASGVILHKKTDEFAQRLGCIFTEIKKICETFSPVECSIEITFANKNPKTTLILGHARAAAIVAIADCGISLFEYEPNKIKKTLTGAGHADKDQISKMIKLLMPTANPKTPDEADAIAIALAHSNTNKFI